MSTSLYWRPAPKNQPDPEYLPVGLKKAISRRLWDHDGSLRGGEVTVGQPIVPYLEGLADAGMDGARELIDAIREHENVILWID